jgi:hypothetical protein
MQNCINGVNTKDNRSQNNNSTSFPQRSLQLAGLDHEAVEYFLKNMSSTRGVKEDSLPTMTKENLALTLGSAGVR